MVGATVKSIIPGAAAFANKKIAILGMGISGVACLEVLQRATTAVVSIWDQKAAAVQKYQENNPNITAGANSDPAALAAAIIKWQPDLVVIAPAFAQTGLVWEKLTAAGIPLCSEIELAWQLRAQNADGSYPQWLCVTGTNGKTTTVTMLAAMLEEAGFGGEAIGNIGLPAIGAVSQLPATPVRAFALELSSFQLAATYTMAPAGAVCLNLAADHLSWHGDLAAYAQAKSRIYERVEKFRIYPKEDNDVQQMLRETAAASAAPSIAYTLQAPAVGEIGLVRDPASGEILAVDRAYVADPYQGAAELFSLADLAHLTPGRPCPPHLVKDALAAAALARAGGVPVECIRAALQKYQVEPHRLQIVGEWEGICWVDDSKATNGHAARAALAAQAGRPIVWIVGGDAKGADFTELVQAEKSRLAGVVVIGKDQEPWKKALADLEIPITYIAAPENPLRPAVAAARNLAKNGDTVLLAPACASLDQFSSYAERGRQFQTEVRQLVGKEQA